MRSFNQWRKLLVALIGAVLFVSLFSAMRFHIEAFEFEIHLEIFDHGLTQIQIPPVGTVSAHTHSTPFKFGIVLRNIDTELLQNLLEETPEQQDLIRRVNAEMSRVVRWFVARLLLLSAVGGIAGIFLLRPASRATYVRGALSGIVMMAVFLAGTYYTYDLERFKNPQYEGVLKAAPWVVGMVQEAMARISTLGAEMQVMAGNLYRLYESIDKLEPVGVAEGTLKVLHVSDIHNNPAAYDFVEKISRSFGIDLIIDTGDLSDFGTPLEAQLTKRIRLIEVPYVFTAGNHDSPEIIKALKRLKNVVVLDGEVREVAGLRIAGIADPSSRSAAITPPPGESVENYIQQLEKVFSQSPTRPDLLAVHNPGIARAFVGRVPVILHGHDHRYSLEVIDGTVVVDAGTTGAAGVRGLQTTNEVPYSVVMLYFSPGTDGWRLVATDTIRVFNLRSGFILERRVFTEKPPVG